MEHAHMHAYQFDDCPHTQCMNELSTCIHTRQTRAHSDSSRKRLMSAKRYEQHVMSVKRYKQRVVRIRLWGLRCWFVD